MLSPDSWDGKDVESNASKDWEVDSKCLLVREDNNELDMHIPSTISKCYHQDINKCSSNKP